MVIELDSIVRGEEPKLRTRGMIASRSVNMVSRPRGGYIVIRFAVSGVATPENRYHPQQEIRHEVPKSIFRAVHGRMQFTLHMPLAEHLSAFRACCKQCPPGW